MPKKIPPLPFSQRLVLNQYLLSLFGVKSFEDLALYVNKMENEGLTADRISKFHQAVVSALPIDGSAPLNEETLLQYDQNIVSHTLAIQGKRPAPIQWKYFQYLGLLFTEVYLDRYMNRRGSLLEELQAFCDGFNQGRKVADQVTNFTENDLQKLAFWSATGSGKTLLMHANIKQFLHYLAQSGRTKEINRILLVTPNEGLSKQHLEEFAESGIFAHAFSKQGGSSAQGSLFSGKSVEIIEITKIGDKDGDKTVAIDSFENNNIVFVDEGHRGSSGKEWSKRRRQLASEGFTFEYSATLGQAVSSDKKLAQEYARSILFDYSYRYFYTDGYGKDYRILNLSEDKDETIRELYLTACLLTFYQQKVLFKNPASKVEMFNIENPLWIFVGSSVNAVRTENKRQVSDVTDILLFLARFTNSKNKPAVLERIERATSGNSGLLNKNGQDIFRSLFNFHRDHLQTPEQIYDGVFEQIFHASGSATLHLEDLKGADGEVALRLGDNEPFGVINVGDTSKLCKLCAEHEELIVTEKTFSGSLFHGINKTDSQINILIGSKKFTEGWSSWRVSTMGLMNIGKSEGSQIIQLFGRGVRLKGWEKSLKRHSALREQGIQYNQYLTQLETLNIFGIRADYMDAFKKYLEDEGVPTGENEEEITIIPNINLGSQKLKTVKLKDGIDYKRNGEKPKLGRDEDLKLGKVTLDYYPRIGSIISDHTGMAGAANKNSAWFTEDHLAFLDVDSIYIELQKFKNERSWFNLSITKEEIPKILQDHSWYEILIPEDEMRFTGFDKIQRWQNIASHLIQKYTERYFLAKKDEWEAPHREYAALTADDPNFIAEYKILIDKSQSTIINQLKSIKDAVEAGELPQFSQFGQGKALFFDQHLYQPLLYCEDKEIIIKPVALNKGEKDFIEDLKAFYEENRSFFEGKEFYLLRNMSRGRGVGFFEAGNFYPDFVLWFIDGDQQHVCFVDPKGIRNLSADDPKITFYKKIKGIEKQLGDPAVHLHSFILSVTPHHIVKKWDSGMTIEDFANLNVFFQEEKGYLNRLLKKVV